MPLLLPAVLSGVVINRGRRMEKGRVGERIGVRRMRGRTGELAAGEGRSEQ